MFRIFVRTHQIGLVLVLAGLLAACGGSNTTTTQMAEVMISPANASISVSQTVQLNATVSNASGSVNWSVNNVLGGNAVVGMISSTGLYTAPAIPPTPTNSVTVQAALASNSSVTATATLTITNPAPQASSVSPASLNPVSGSAALTIAGSGFTPQSAVSAGSTPLATTFVSSAELTAALPSSVAAAPGLLALTVTTPGPGGGTSAALTVTVIASGAVSSTNNPQVAQYSLTPPQSANVTVEFGTDTTYGRNTWSQPAPAGGGQVNVLVAGMKAFTTYHMRAVATFPDGTQYVDSDHTFTTGGLPAERLPGISITVPPGPSTSPGIELLSLAAGSTNQIEATAVDLDGNVIWYYDFSNIPGVGPDLPFPIKLLPNGHMKLVIGTVIPNAPVSEVQEIDLAGNVISQMTYTDLNARLAQAGFTLVNAGFHHDFAILPNGHTIYLVMEQRNVVLNGETSPTLVTGDALVDIDPNGNPVWTWSTFDHLDVNYHPYQFPDWTHGNAVIYSMNDGDLVLSMRNVSWIAKIDYRNGAGTGNVLWKLGSNGDFTLQNGGPSDWFYNQHYPSFTTPVTIGNFKLGVWDNGNTRPDPITGIPCGTGGFPGGVGPCYSRGVILNINEPARTANIVWQDNLSPLFAGCCGDLNVLANSNVDLGAGATSFAFPQSTEALEVTQQLVPEVVWQMNISGQFSYRMVRIPSLYPGVTWPAP